MQMKKRLSPCRRACMCYWQQIYTDNWKQLKHLSIDEWINKLWFLWILSKKKSNWLMKPSEKRSQVNNVSLENMHTIWLYTKILEKVKTVEIVKDQYGQDWSSGTPQYHKISTIGETWSGQGIKETIRNLSVFSVQVIYKFETTLKLVILNLKPKQTKMNPLNRARKSKQLSRILLVVDIIMALWLKWPHYMLWGHWVRSFRTFGKSWVLWCTSIVLVLAGKVERQENPCRTAVSSKFRNQNRKATNNSYLRPCCKQ